jgi:hypothetical protein
MAKLFQAVALIAGLSSAGAAAAQSAIPACVARISAAAARDVPGACEAGLDFYAEAIRMAAANNGDTARTTLLFLGGNRVAVVADMRRKIVVQVFGLDTRTGARRGCEIVGTDAAPSVARSQADLAATLSRLFGCR